MAASQRAFQGWLSNFESLIKDRVRDVGIEGFFHELYFALRDIPWDRAVHRNSAHWVVHYLLTWYYKHGALLMEPPPFFPLSDIGCLIYRSDLEILRRSDNPEVHFEFLHKLLVMCQFNAGEQMTALQTFLGQNGMAKELEGFPCLANAYPQALKASVPRKRIGHDQSEDPAAKRTRLGTRDMTVVRSALGSGNGQASSALVLSLQQQVQAHSQREKELTQELANSNKRINDLEEANTRWYNEYNRFKAENDSLNRHYNKRIKMWETLYNENKILQAEVATLKTEHDKERQALIKQYDDRIAKLSDVTENPKYLALEEESEKHRSSSDFYRNALLEVKKAMRGV